MLRKELYLLGLLLVSVLVVGALAVFAAPGNNFRSVELDVAAYSPMGVEGGAVLPASGGSTYCGPTADTACPGDICFNIEGLQYSPPEGYTAYENYGVTRQCCYYTETFTGYGCVPAYSQSYYQGYYQSAYPPTAPTIGCSPSTINSGSSSTCSWSCSGSSTAGLGFSTGGALTGDASVSPTATTAYTVQCIGPGGTSQTSTTVTVNNPVLSLSADPTRVRSGNSSTITWSATQVTSCAISGPGVSATGLSGSRSTGALTSQSRYTLTCQTVAGVKTASVLVNVIPAQTEI